MSSVKGSNRVGAVIAPRRGISAHAPDRSTVRGIAAIDDAAPVVSKLAAPLYDPPGVAAEPTYPLASLLGQARAAQAQLAIQPLPISNHRNRLITQLFGG